MEFGGFTIVGTAVISFLIGAAVATLVYRWAEVRPERAKIESELQAWLALGERYVPRRVNYAPRVDRRPTSPIAGASAQRRGARALPDSARGIDGHQGRARRTEATDRDTEQRSGRPS